MVIVAMGHGQSYVGLENISTQTNLGVKRVKPFIEKLPNLQEEFSSNIMLGTANLHLYKLEKTVIIEKIEKAPNTITELNSVKNAKCMVCIINIDDKLR